jgi:hypothetical protein
MPSISPKFWPSHSGSPRPAEDGMAEAARTDTWQPHIGIGI